MQFSSRKADMASASQSPERSIAVQFKFTQTGKYLVAAGSEWHEARGVFTPVLYMNVVGESGWATQYPRRGSFKDEDEAAAAALHYAIQIITRQVKHVPRPGDPVQPEL